MGELALTPYLDHLEDLYRKISESMTDFRDVNQDQLKQLLDDVAEVGLVVDLLKQAPSEKCCLFIILLQKFIHLNLSKRIRKWDHKGTNVEIKSRV